MCHAISTGDDCFRECRLIGSASRFCGVWVKFQRPLYPNSYRWCSSWGDTRRQLIIVVWSDCVCLSGKCRRYLESYFLQKRKTHILVVKIIGHNSLATVILFVISFYSPKTPWQYTAFTYIWILSTIRRFGQLWRLSWVWNLIRKKPWFKQPDNASGCNKKISSKTLRSLCQFYIIVFYGLKSASVGWCISIVKKKKNLNLHLNKHVSNERCQHFGVSCVT